MPGRTRTTGGIRALALATVVLVLLTGTVTNRASRASAAPLVPGADFSISTTITSSPTSADHAALLYPGVTRYLWYTVHNPLPQAITVTSLGIAGVQAPPACPRANLDLDQLGLTGAFIVPSGATATVLAPRPISLRNLPVNQDACKDVTFTFTFTGTGWYSDGSNPQDPQNPQNPTDPQNPPAPDSPAKVGTATQLSAGPNPVAVGQPVTISSRVARTTGAVTGTGTAGASAIPSGAVSFYLRAPSGALTLLGTIPLDAQGAASLRLTSLPPGSGSLYAVYSGTDTFAGSTSPVVPQSIIAPPAQCTGTYTTSIIGTPGSPVIKGTTGNDFIYAVGGTFRVSGGKGNDCLVVGDGNNVIADGTGSDVVIAGNGRNTITVTGSRNTVIIGNGDGNRVTVKGAKKGKKYLKPSSNSITIGNGDRNRITVRKGTNNQVTLGSGASNRVTVKGSKNRVTVGNGAKNRITLRKGTRNIVIVGKGKGNRVTTRAASKRSNTCSLPTPPPSWRGSPAAYYRDTIRRCKVVTR